MQEQGEHLLGNWRVVREIGRGGMGVVHLAEHRFIPDKRAAVKVLQPELSRERSVTDRFFKEAIASSRIRHPGIVEVFDCGFSGDTAYLVMEYLEGENLGAWLQSGLRRVSLPELLGISRQIATALEAAHKLAIVHRDLKPENVFITHTAGGDEPVVKVLDFGIAKLMNPKDARLTRQGSILGTPRYMSPEQCRGEIDVDGRADVYALGCIMFEMVCGRPPFVSKSEGELFAAHMQQPPPDPAPFAPALPPALHALILRALAKDPADRPPSMAALEADLAAIAADPRGGDTVALAAAPPPATVVLPSSTRALSLEIVPPTANLAELPTAPVTPVATPAARPTPLETAATIAPPPPEPPTPEPEPAAAPPAPKRALWQPFLAFLRFVPIPAGIFAVVWFSVHPTAWKRLTTKPLPPIFYPVVSVPAGARVCHPGDRKLLGQTPVDVQSSDEPGGNRVLLELDGHRSQEVTLPLKQPVRLKKLRGDELADVKVCLD